MKCVAKLMPASSMKTTSTASIAGEFQAAMLASRVEKPPRLIAENAWQSASNQSMPGQAQRRACKRA